MQRGLDAPTPAMKTRARTLARDGAGRWRTAATRRGRGRPLRGPRAGDRFALTVISLALDQVDAAGANRRRESKRYA
jgi:hypothetical protein